MQTSKVKPKHVTAPWWWAAVQVKQIILEKHKPSIINVNLLKHYKLRKYSERC